MQRNWLFSDPSLITTCIEDPTDYRYTYSWWAGLKTKPELWLTRTGREEAGEERRAARTTVLIGLYSNSVTGVVWKKKKKKLAESWEKNTPSRLSGKGSSILPQPFPLPFSLKMNAVCLFITDKTPGRHPYTFFGPATWRWGYASFLSTPSDRSPRQE